MVAYWRVRAAALVGVITFFVLDSASLARSSTRLDGNNAEVGGLSIAAGDMWALVAPDDAGDFSMDRSWSTDPTFAELFVTNTSRHFGITHLALNYAFFGKLSVWNGLYFDSYTWRTRRVVDDTSAIKRGDRYPEEDEDLALSRDFLSSKAGQVFRSILVQSVLAARERGDETFEGLSVIDSRAAFVVPAYRAGDGDIALDAVALPKKTGQLLPAPSAITDRLGYGFSGAPAGVPGPADPLAVPDMSPVATTVPLPAPIWLFLAGGALLVGLRGPARGR